MIIQILKIWPKQTRKREVKYITYLEYLQRIKMALSNTGDESHIITLTQDDLTTHVRVFPNMCRTHSDI